MGTLYANTFRRLGHNLAMSIDPNSSRQLGTRHNLHLGDILQSDLDRIDLLVLAAPTDQHLAELKNLAKRNFSGLVLIEKPYTAPNDIGLLETFLASEGSQLRLFFSDPYGQISLLKNLSAFWNLKDLERIDIEFSKNRSQDQKNGRFVDHDFGVLGYEYFHMLSILGQILPPSWDFNVSKCAVSELSADIHLVEQRSNVQIRISSAMDGNLFQKDILSSGVFPSTAISDSQTFRISEGDAFRYRKASFHFSSRKTIHLVFERHFGSDLDYKNIHSFVIQQDDDVTEIIDFACNLIEIQVTNALQCLSQGASFELKERNKFLHSVESHRWISNFKELSWNQR